MTDLTIRDLDAALSSRLRSQAAAHGRSTAEEVLDILRSALSSEPARESSLAASLRARFAPLGGFELPLAVREPIRSPPSFDE